MLLKWIRLILRKIEWIKIAGNLRVDIKIPALTEQLPRSITRVFWNKYKRIIRHFIVAENSSQA